MIWLIRSIINSTCRKNLWFECMMTTVDDRRQRSSSFICYMSFHSQFVYWSKVIAKLYTFYHLITRQTRKPKHMLRVLFETLRVLLELNPSNVYVTLRLSNSLYRVLQWSYDELFVDDQKSRFCLSIFIRK